MAHALEYPGHRYYHFSFWKSFKHAIILSDFKYIRFLLWILQWEMQLHMRTKRHIYPEGIYGPYYFPRLQKLQFKTAPVQNEWEFKHVLSNEKELIFSSPPTFSTFLFLRKNDFSDWCGQSKLACPCFHPAGDELGTVWGMSTHVKCKIANKRFWQGLWMQISLVSYPGKQTLKMKLKRNVLEKNPLSASVKRHSAQAWAKAKYRASQQLKNLQHPII